jgi:uncharacterized alkaline shock family protein YloU
MAATGEDGLAAGPGRACRRTSPHVTPESLPGRALVTRRAVSDIVNRAAAASYGVVGFTDPDVRSRLLAALGRRSRGLRVRISPTLDVELFIRVALGVPIAQVAANVEAAVRYAVRQTLGREIDAFTIHVDGIVVQPRDRRDQPGATGA